MMDQRTDKSDFSITDKSPNSKNDTIFEPRMTTNFWVLLKEKGNEVPSYRKQISSDYLYRISLSTGKEQLIRCYFELNDHYLFCFKETSKSLVAYLDLEYAKIKEITHTVNGQAYFGVRIIKGRNYEDILSEREATATKWYNLLKKFCVLSQFGMTYENVKVLGQGNFAKVFLVKRKSDQQLFAAKVFDKKAISGDELEKKCLLYEVNTLRSLDHANVMKLLELYEGQNYVYCLTEAYLGGHLLQRILKKPNGRFSEVEALEIIYRILSGLAYLESQDIIHRDLKPENIIFRDKDDPYEVVIVDFGFATKVEDFKSLFTRCGTPGYVAPEVLNDFPYNCKADVFSSGIILYILLTGCAPFYGDDYDEVVDKNLKAELNYNFEEIGLKLESSTLDLLKGLLKKVPKSRLSASEALKHPAFDLIDSNKNVDDDTNVGEHVGLHQNLKEFHEKYKFNIKGFPKGDQKRENNIPDNIADLNTPMLEADHRVIKQMKPTVTGSVGLTPMLQSRAVDRPKVQMDTGSGMNKSDLKEIREEKEDLDERPKKAPASLFNNLRGL